MFPFSPPQGPEDIKRVINAELSLYNTVISNAVNVAFEISDLNRYALKQSVDNWTARSRKLEVGNGLPLAACLDTEHFKKDLEALFDYGQKISKILLELQSDLNKLAQDRATQVWGSAVQENKASVSDMNGQAVNFIQNLVQQASQGYSQWANTAMHALDAMESDLNHAATVPERAPAARARSRSK